MDIFVVGEIKESLVGRIGDAVHTELADNPSGGSRKGVLDLAGIEKFVTTGNTIAFAGDGMYLHALCLQPLYMIPHRRARDAELGSNVFSRMRAPVLQPFQEYESFLHQT